MLLKKMEFGTMGVNNAGVSSAEGATMGNDKVWGSVL